MDIERMAVLIWRFIGLLIVVAALPGALMQAFGGFANVWGADELAADLRAGGALTAVLATLKIVVGTSVMAASGRLGRLIAHGI